MTLYDELGGGAAVAMVVDDFYERVTGDPSLAPWFTGVDLPALKGHQRMFVGAALGGPERYLGRDMASAHAGLGITDEAFDTVVEHLAASLAGVGVPAVHIETIAGVLGPLKPQIVGAAETVA